MGTATMPMFPLGTVLFPYAQLPLQVFEPRYRVMTEHCLAGDGEFGVVLIERGSEVGGGDTRFDIGTVARIVGAGRVADGRIVLATTGTRRLRVREWLPEEPYPRADVELLDEPEPIDDASDAVEAVERLLHQLAGLRAAVAGAFPPGDVRLAPEPVRASFEAAAFAGLGPLDAQRLLELNDPRARLRSLIDLVADEIRFLELRRAES
jgi:Lon protease-like protein